MQADLAIYAYDVGGVKECVIFDDVSVGRVFKYGVIDELCVAIVEDINSGNLHTFRSNAKRKKKEFTWNIVASNYLDYYEKII
jgi:glycosyltransferase involved in cell wall biosynthesis